MPVDAENQHKTFSYTRKQEADLIELVSILKSINRSIQTVKVTPGYQESRAQERQALKCPKCQSLNIAYMGNQRKSFSVKKAVAGGLLVGGIGTAAGFVGKKGQDRWHCKACGEIFDTKPK